MLALGALECSLIVIWPIVRLDANNPHWPVASRARLSVDRRWWMSIELWSGHRACAPSAASGQWPPTTEGRHPADCYQRRFPSSV